ncbi:MAG: winged helix-turn-helix transcriptional regulator, partial [Gammaproteobacteria bacterium]
MKAVSDYGHKIDRLRDNCPVKAAIDVIRGRWKPSILWELNGGTKRFSDLQAALRGITAQVLTVQLRQLEADGVVIRSVYPEIPVRVEYALGEHGRALSAVMDQLEAWGTPYLERQARIGRPQKPGADWRSHFCEPLTNSGRSKRSDFPHDGRYEIAACHQFQWARHALNHPPPHRPVRGS